jgi:hypothetical protein
LFPFLAGVTGGTAATGATPGSVMQVPAHYLASVAICQPRYRLSYLPLLLSFGVVDVAVELVLGVLEVDVLAAPDDGVDEEDGVEDDSAFDSDDDEGGVPDALDDDGLLDDELSVERGVVDDEDDDIEPLVAGGVVVVVDDEDVDGDGVTTGGVVLLVVDDVSRLQPATPKTTPLTSSATNAVFIPISNELRKGCPTPN